MAADVVQHERNNIKRYASAFSNIEYRWVCLCWFFYTYPLNSSKELNVFLLNIYYNTYSNPNK